MKRRFRKLIALLAIATSISSMAAPLTAEAAEWKKDTTGWWYSYDNGTYAKNGWKLIDNTWYYFDKSGYMKTGWVKDGNTWYYMKDSGAMATGWVKDGGTWYYMDASGAMKTGWVQDGNTWYYLKDSGAMATGWVKSGDIWYYMDASGAMKTGWVEDGGKKYYMDESGAMQTGWFELGNDNKLTTRIDTTKATFAERRAEAKKKFIYLGEDGAMVTGWQDITTKYGVEKFYFDADGVMAIGTKRIDGQWYYFHKCEEETYYTRVYNDKTGGYSIGAMQSEGVKWIKETHGSGATRTETRLYGWEIVDGTTVHYTSSYAHGYYNPNGTYSDESHQFQRALAANKDKLFEYDYNISSGGKSQYTKGLYYVCSDVRCSDGVVISTVDNVQYGTLNGYRNAEVEALFEKYYREKFNIPDDYTINLSKTLGQMWGYKNVGEDGDLGDMLVYFAESDRVSAYDSNGVRYKYSLDENGNVVCEGRK